MAGFVGCSRQPATPPSPEASVGASTDASPPPVDSAASTEAGAPESTATIGLAGGTYRAEGVTMIIPPDALKAERKFKITKLLDRLPLLRGRRQVVRSR
jgi:hypothetical protein